MSGLVAMLGGTAAWAATDAPRGAIVLWTGDDQWVRIERQDDPAALPNDHPASLDAAAVMTALGALRIRLADPGAGAETERAVFTHDEIGNLAPRVAAGLSKAGPRQDVTFSTLGSHPLGAGGLIKDPGVNAGRIFYAGGKLNVIFGELQSNYRKRNVYGQRSEDFSPRRQGTRKKASEHRWTFATLPGIALHSTSAGGVRNDWVTIDPTVARAQTVAAPQPSAPRSPSPAPPPPASVGGSEPAADSAPEPAAATAPGATGNASADLERRLRVLKDLKDKGLISEEVYNAKVQELLSGL